MYWITNQSDPPAPNIEC